MPSFHVTTFGCQMNEHDSERMKGMLESLGYQETAERSAADLILFNTCSIRESADNRFIAHLGEAKRLKSEHPERVVAVGGCWAQSVKEEVFERFPFVDVAFGPGQVHKLAEFLTSDSLTAQGYFEFEGFAQTLDVCEEVAYDGAFTFVYSPRRGTEAADIVEGVVPHEVKVERMQRLGGVLPRPPKERPPRFGG